MSAESKVSCYITAGGKATRMNGCIKAFIEIDGERIIDKNLREINSIFSEIGIITNTPDQFISYREAGLQIVSDKYTDIGPLAGIHSAIYNTDADYVFIMASDMPNISKGLIKDLISKAISSKADAIIPTYNGKIEPLFAVYNKSIFMQLETFIEKDESYAVRDFVKILNTVYYNLSDIFEDNNVFRNINYKNEIPIKINKP